MKFSELSETAKQIARNRQRIYDGWWDSVYEDAVTVAEILGIEIDERRQDGPKIYFSGFSSQGDGASFEGRYTVAADAVEKITEYCGGQDVELIRIATELTMLNVGRRLRGADKLLKATVIARGHYSHIGTMELLFDDFYDDGYLTDAEENTLLRLMRAFADWIYKQLEAEYDYLTSDEQFADEDFDESGAVI